MVEGAANQIKNKAPGRMSGGLAVVWGQITRITHGVGENYFSSLRFLMSSAVPLRDSREVTA